MVFALVENRGQRGRGCVAGKGRVMRAIAKGPWAGSMRCRERTWTASGAEILSFSDDVRGIGESVACHEVAH